MGCLRLLGPSIALLIASATWIAGSAESASPAAPSCSAAAQARAVSELADAEKLAAGETRGVVAYRALRGVAHDATLVGALRAGRLRAARAEAHFIVFRHYLPGGKLLLHLVRLRITMGSRVVVDPNSSNFAVDGPSTRLRRHNGRPLGTLKISIQDVVGYVKYVHDLFRFDLVAGGPGGTVTSLPALPSQPLPASGCVTIGGASYAVQSFGELSFVGDRLTVWVLATN
jgi:hypothetical protein